MKKQVDQKHYYRHSYDRKENFVSYWHQIDEIQKTKHDIILEIGIGNSFISNYLKSRNKKLFTIDFDYNLKPDIVGNVLKIPFKNNSFDVVACYEVLEHLPFDYFLPSLWEINRITKNYAIISLPDVTPKIRIFLQLPFLKLIKMFNYPLHKTKIHTFNGEHYWEIGKHDYMLKRVVLNIAKSGFKIEKTYRVFEHPYHRFFILKK